MYKCFVIRRYLVYRFHLLIISTINRFIYIKCSMEHLSYDKHFSPLLNPHAVGLPHCVNCFFCYISPPFDYKLLESRGLDFSIALSLVLA